METMGIVTSPTMAATMEHCDVMIWETISDSATDGVTVLTGSGIHMNLLSTESQVVFVGKTDE